MPLPSTMTPIATNTLTSNLASGVITFSNIPQTYTDLVIVAVGQGYTSSSYGNLQVQFNGDTGTNYSSTELKEFAGTASTSRRSTQSYLFATSFLDAGSASLLVGTSIINVMNYANATTYKTTLSRGNLPGFKTELNVGLWRSTAAITSLTLTANDTPINAGASFTLYGIKAA